MYKRNSQYIQHCHEAREPQAIHFDLLRQDLHRVRAALKRQLILTGRVIRIEAYGVFVKLGTVEGLIHTRQLTAVLHIGQQVQVRVLRIASNGTRIVLSMRLTPLLDEAASKGTPHSQKSTSKVHRKSTEHLSTQHRLLYDSGEKHSSSPPQTSGDQTCRLCGAQAVPGERACYICLQGGG